MQENPLHLGPVWTTRESGPQLAMLGEQGRLEFTDAKDTEALEALKFFARTEGLIFAMESAHAGAAAMKLAKEMRSDQNLIINMSGPGRQGYIYLRAALDGENWRDFLSTESRRDQR